jgi:hypothetical protein
MLKITYWCQVGRGKYNHTVLKYDKVSNVFVQDEFTVDEGWFNLLLGLLCR